MVLGLIGVFMFGLTLPFTSIAVQEMSPFFVGVGRAVLAGLCAAAFFVVSKPSLPKKHQLLRLAVMIVGVVYVFPILMSWAMKTLPSAHGGIVLGILPLVTAAVGAIRAKERPSYAFWFIAFLGSLLVVLYAALDGGGSPATEDWLLLIAVICVAVGYCEGGKLAQEMGAINVISWALVITLPLNIIVAYWLIDFRVQDLSAPALLSFAYVGVFSMYVGFMFWYKGLAMGGIARVGQAQLMQPFFTLIAAYFILGESITLVNLIFVIAVVAIIIIGLKTKAQ